MLPKSNKSLKFSIMVLANRHYDDKIPILLKHISQNKKICYLCISRPFQNIKKYLNKNKINCSNFYFIDILSGKIEIQKDKNRCIFIEPPLEPRELVSAILKWINLKNCDMVLFDTINHLLYYHTPFQILKMANNIRKKFLLERVGNIFLINKDEFISETDNNLIKDLALFTDEVIVLNN